MLEGDRTSETQAPATGASGGEQPGTTPVPSTPSSKGGAAEQEQPTTEAGQVGDAKLADATLAAPAIDPEERIRREVQSRSDTIVAQKLRQIEEQRAQQAETARLRGLSDREYRLAMQQQERDAQVQQTVRDQAQAQIAGVLGQFVNEALAIIPDKAVREDLARRSNTDEFSGPGEFIQAVFDAATELKAAKLRTSIQKSEQTAAQKEARAEQGGRPQLGTGLSTPNLTGMTPQQKIRMGIEIAQREGK